MDDILINYGSEVKALGNGRVGGYLVTFGDETTPDLSEHRDFFTPSETDYDIEDGAKTTMYFHHGLDKKLGVTKLGKVEMKTDEVGIWAEGILALRDDYEKTIYQMCEAGKLSWSSGATTHLVRREKVAGKNASRVTNWPISEASLTPIPADSRNLVMAIKSASFDVNAYDSLTEIKTELTDEAIDQSGDAMRGVVSALNAMPLKTYLQAMRRVSEGFNERVTFLLEESASAKSGRTISAANAADLDEICAGMERDVSRLRGMVDKHKTNSDTNNAKRTDNSNLAHEFTRYLAVGAAGAGAVITL